VLKEALSLPSKRMKAPRLDDIFSAEEVITVAAAAINVFFINDRIAVLLTRKCRSTVDKRPLINC
jgi:hypothetical protein